MAVWKCGWLADCWWVMKTGNRVGRAILNVWRGVLKNFQTSPISVSGSVAQFDRIESSFIVPKMPQSNFKNYPKTKNNISTCLRCFILSMSTQKSICIDWYLWNWIPKENLKRPRVRIIKHKMCKYRGLFCKLLLQIKNTLTWHSGCQQTVSPEM